MLRNTLICLTLLLLAACSSRDGAKIQQTAPDTILQDRRGLAIQAPPSAIDESSSAFTRRFSAIPPTRVGLLLPLSGKYADLGQSMLDAATFALFSVNEPSIILMPFDTKGTPFGAQEAAKSAVDKGVKLILGPVFGKSAKAVAPIAESSGINIVSFSNDKTLADSGVFAIGFIPSQQIKRVVEFAMWQGIEDFTAVLPNSSYGAAVAKELRLAVDDNPEASVLKAEYYIHTRGNYNKHVYAAYNTALTKKPPKDFDKELEQYNFNPIKYPRAMLVVDGGRALERISKALEKYNFDSDMVKILGGSNLFKKKVLEYPELVGAWFAMPPRDRREVFEGKFAQIFAYKPKKISSLAYDGIALAVTLARLSKGRDFSAEALTNPRGFVGVDGIFRLQKNGLTQRGLAVYEVGQEGFAVVDPAPSSFLSSRFGGAEN